MPSAIEAAGLRKHYPPDVQALDGLDLEVEEGTIFALLGPNGAGKSTTVKILTTLTAARRGRGARRRPRRARASPERVRRAIGVVGQKHGFDPEATGRENLRAPGRRSTTCAGRALAAARRRAARALRPRRGGRPAGEDLLGRHAAPARHRAWACSTSPQVLFLDEPTTGLDPEARADMWAEIDAARRATSGLTILLTTHYLEEADELAARLAIVDRGRIVAAGTPDELKGALEGDTLQIELAERRADGACADVLARVAGLTRGRRRRPRRPGARAARRHGDAGRARGPRGGRDAVASVTDGAPLARRRLPAPRRPLLPRRGREERRVTTSAPPQPGTSRSATCAPCSASPRGSRSP